MGKKGGRERERAESHISEERGRTGAKLKARSECEQSERGARGEPQEGSNRRARGGQQARATQERVRENEKDSSKSSKGAVLRSRPMWESRATACSPSRAPPALVLLPPLSLGADWRPPRSLAPSRVSLPSSACA
eukprot:4081086-Pleurochrysis_carterae.AAC.1